MTGTCSASKGASSPRIQAASTASNEASSTAAPALTGSECCLIMHCVAAMRAGDMPMQLQAPKTLSITWWYCERVARENNLGHTALQEAEPELVDEGSRIAARLAHGAWVLKP